MLFYQRVRLTMPLEYGISLFTIKFHGFWFQCSLKPIRSSPLTFTKFDAKDWEGRMGTKVSMQVQLFLFLREKLAISKHTSWMKKTSGLYYALYIADHELRVMCPA